MRSLVFTALFLAMLPAALRYAHVATMLWVWIAMVSPTHYIYGFAQQIPFNKLVVAVGVIALAVDRQYRPKLRFDAHMVLLLAFLAVAMISYMFALTRISRVDDLADRLFKVVMLCLFVVATVRTRLQIHSVMIAACMGMGIHGAIEAAKYLASAGGHVLLGPATIGDNNHFGLAILMTIPPLAYLFRYSQALVVKVAFAAAALGNVIGVIASHSRGALIGLVAVGAAVFFKSRNKGVMLLVLAVLAGIVLAIAPERWFDRMGTIDDARADGSFMGRVSSWKMNLLVALDRPLVGGGFSSMEDNWVFSQYLRFFPSLDWLAISPTPTRPLAAHSIYFQVLGDTGFIGLFLFLALLALAFHNTRVIRRLTADREDLQWAHDLSLAVYFSLIGYAVSGAALSLAYFEFYYLLITVAAVTRYHVETELGVVAKAKAAALRPVHPAFQVGGAAVRPGMAGRRVQR
jgi:putative inorganic carbon (HCO3(-)) transporter